MTRADCKRKHHLSLESAISRIQHISFGLNVLDKIEKRKKLSKEEINYVGKAFINRMRKYYKSCQPAQRKR